MTRRRALVTGGSGAIGAAICHRLAADGMHVVVHGNRHGDHARRIAADIVAGGGAAEAVVFDVTDEAAAERAVGPVLEAGAVQVLVHNAGIFDDAPLAGMTSAQWHAVIDVSLTGFFNATRPLLLPMLRTRWGRIIAISSVSALIGNRGQANYAAAKAGLHGAAKSLALECASRGVTVNVVAPGIIETTETATHFPAERIADLVPMNRAGTPDDVAGLVGYLASERAGYVTGQIISVSGGMA